MQLTELIERAVNALATHGDISVNVEAKDNGEWIRRHVPCTDIQTKREGFKEVVFVIQGGRESKFKD